jgi:hypothetical protein
LAGMLLALLAVVAAILKDLKEVALSLVISQENVQILLLDLS